MKRTKLDIMDVAQLVEAFVSIAIEQDKAQNDENISKYNRLYREMDKIKNTLKDRPGDQRRALCSLFTHPNRQVRLKAAVSTLALAPQEARKVLEVIQAAGVPPQALDAGMTLFALDRGTFVPE